MTHETHHRSIAKAIVWRIISTIVTILIILIVTREPYISVGIGLLDALISLGLYYCHERAWQGIKWGLK